MAAQSLSKALRHRLLQGDCMLVSTVVSGLRQGVESEPAELAAAVT